MRILIEDHTYETKDVREILGNYAPLENRNTISLPYVGYLYNKVVDDCVFFLPKVILDEQGLIFKKYTPEQLLDVDSLTGDDVLTPEQRTFLYSFSVWIYQAVNVYNHRNPDNIIVKKKSFSDIDFSTNEVHVTVLDNIIALIKFANDNQDFLLFTIRNIHSGFNKINWIQTIARQQPLIRKGKAPIYLNPVNRKKETDYEEELLVIFFSILRHIEEKYGFKTKINQNFELIPKSQFDKYLNGYGKQRLREIKYKYFSDKTLQIWKLCYAFFSMSEKANSSEQSEDYMIASDFDRVFESIIDDLIGQRTDEYPKYLKTQKDGKEIDHLFSYESLTNPEQSIYYIGDSKYYKTGDDVHGNSEYKQYTYAKNVIQANIDLMLRDLHGKHIKDEYITYRDEKTEGYDITPNFFISAGINDDFNYADEDIIHRPNKDTIKVHFDNRLFDRDTLLLSHYDVNFLYVITLYANSNDYSKEVYRNKVRQIFREETLKRLNDRYVFYILELKNKPKPGEEYDKLNAALNQIFRLVNGKIICPKVDRSYTNLILALERPEKSEARQHIIKQENKMVLDAVKDDFKIYDGYQIGGDITVFLRKKGQMK